MTPPIPPIRRRTGGDPAEHPPQTGADLGHDVSDDLGDGAGDDLQLPAWTQIWTQNAIREAAQRNSPSPMPAALVAPDGDEPAQITPGRVGGPAEGLRPGEPAELDELLDGLEEGEPATELDDAEPDSGLDGLATSTTRRRRRSRRGSRADEDGGDSDPASAGGPAGSGGSAAGVLELPPLRGFRVRRSSRRARRGWYAPQAAPALTSTRQAEILNTALVAAPTGAAGTLIGRDKLSNTPVAHDPFTAYEGGVISSPAVVVLGVIGAGKSSLLKTVYVMRPLILRGRRVVVMDRKDRGGEGEYAELTRRLGSEPLRFVVGQSGGTRAGGTVLNVLDPTILAGDGIAGQARLLIALAELANDGAQLDKWEKAALRAAHRATLRAAETRRHVPVLQDLLHHLGRVNDTRETWEPGETSTTGVPAGEFGDYSPAARERMHQAGLGVRHLLSALLSDELAGMFDGPTSPSVQLSRRLTTFDISQLPDDGPATSMVMAVANVWLLGTLRHRRGLRTNFVAEEGWDLVGGPGGRVFMRNSKLARGLGLSNIAALHHIADIPEHDPAIAMLKEAQTVHLYRQDRDDDIEATMRLYGLDPGSRSTLANLADGHHLLKIGNRREIHVEHIRSRLERSLTNTDEAMVSAEALAQSQSGPRSGSGPGRAR